MEPSRNVRPNALAANAGLSPMGLAFEQKEPARGTGIQTKCKNGTDKAIKERGNSVVTDDGVDGASDDRQGDGFEAIIAAAAKIRLSNERERQVVENIKHWEHEALTHFKNSSWKDVIAACTKVLQVPGQSDTNFDIQYEIGYAYMRLEEYETALPHLIAAHRIDGQRVCLRMALQTLKEKMERGPWRKRGRDEVTKQRDEPAKRAHSAGW